MVTLVDGLIPIKKTCMPVDSVPMPGAVMVSDVRPVMAKEPEEMIALKTPFVAPPAVPEACPRITPATLEPEAALKATPAMM